MPKSRKRDASGQKKSRRGGAAYTIREECERLFCESMKTVFLVESDTASNGSIELGALNSTSPPDERMNENEIKGYFNQYQTSHIKEWLEVWDYAGGCSFRGFVAGTGQEKSMFVFFDAAVVGRDLKQGFVFSNSLS